MSRFLETVFVLGSSLVGFGLSVDPAWLTNAGEFIRAAKPPSVSYIADWRLTWPAIRTRWCGAAASSGFAGAVDAATRRDAGPR
jgi:hypothetical protein